MTVEDVAARVERDLNAAIMADPVLSNLFASMATREANWRYFGKMSAKSKRGARVYCWSTEKVDGKYHSWVYVHQGGDKWAMRKQVTHRLRRQAKARALKLASN